MVTLHFLVVAPPVLAYYAALYAAYRGTLGTAALVAPMLPDAEALGMALGLVQPPPPPPRPKLFGLF